MNYLDFAGEEPANRPYQRPLPPARRRQRPQHHCRQRNTRIDKFSKCQMTKSVFEINIFVWILQISFVQKFSNAISADCKF